MAYLSCPACGLTVYRRPRDAIVDTNCPRCGRTRAQVDRLGPDFGCVVRHEAGGAVVELSGELDSWTVRLLDAKIEALRADGINSVTVDLRGLSFMDSSGIAALLGWSQRGSEESFEFELVDGSPPVDRVIDMCGVREVLSFREPHPPQPAVNS